MWRDEQLLAEGWTQEQIKQWRLEQTPDAGEDNWTGQELWRLLFSQTVTFV